MRISLNQKFTDAIKKDMRKEDENGRLYYNFASHNHSGKPHKMVAIGDYVDFYDPKTGDKLYGKVLSYYSNGMVDIQVDGKKYKVRGYAPSMITLTEGTMAFSEFLSESIEIEEFLNESLTPKQLLSVVANDLEEVLHKMKCRLQGQGFTYGAEWGRIEDSNLNFPGYLVYEFQVRYLAKRIGEWDLEQRAKDYIRYEAAQLKREFPKIEISYQTSEKGYTVFFSKIKISDAKEKAKELGYKV